MPVKAKELVVEFFATPAELVAWAGEWIERYGLHHLLVPPAPSADYIDSVPWQDVEAATAMLECSRFLYFRRTPFDTSRPATSYIPLPDRDYLRLILPRANERGAGSLGWCQLDSLTNDPKAWELWLAIRKDLLKRTGAGVWFTAPDRKRPFLDKKERYTEGVEKLLAEGVSLHHMGDVFVHHFGKAQAR